MRRRGIRERPPTRSRLRVQFGDSAGAADALDRALYIDPYDITVHQRLADLYRGLKERENAVRERRAVVALGPADKAEAYYELAVAWHAAGDDANARASLLRSLEEAPNYVRAQELLLEIVDGRRP